MCFLTFLQYLKGVTQTFMRRAKRGLRLYIGHWHNQQVQCLHMHCFLETTFQNENKAKKPAVEETNKGMLGVEIMDKVLQKETDIRPLNTIDSFNQKATQVDAAYHFTVLHFLHLISTQKILNGINGVLTIALLCYKEMNIIMLPPLSLWRGLCSMEYILSHKVHILEKSICLTPKSCKNWLQHSPHIEGNHKIYFSNQDSWAWTKSDNILRETDWKQDSSQIRCENLKGQDPLVVWPRQGSSYPIRHIYSLILLVPDSVHIFINTECIYLKSHM